MAAGEGKSARCSFGSECTTLFELVVQLVSFGLTVSSIGSPTLRLHDLNSIGTSDSAWAFAFSGPYRLAVASYFLKVALRQPPYIDVDTLGVVVRQPPHVDVDSLGIELRQPPRV